jgi:hypothetical protein
MRESLELRETVEGKVIESVVAISNAFTALSGTLVPMEFGQGRRKHQRSGLFLNSHEQTYLAVLKKSLNWPEKDFKRLVAYLKEAPDTRMLTRAYHDVWDLIERHHSEEKLIGAPRAIAERFWRSKENRCVKNMLARIALYPNALNPEKDTERGIDRNTMKDTSARGESREIESLLCEMAEGNTVLAATKNTGLLVNKVIFFKTSENGRPVGLCIKDVRLPNGQVFLSGMYYSADRHSRFQLNTLEYDTRKGATGLRAIPDAEIVWKPVRAIRSGRKIGKHAWRAVQERLMNKA